MKASQVPIFVVSGGSGASGDHLLQSALAQFDSGDANVTLFPVIREPAQIAPLLVHARREGALVVHTLVDAALRRVLIDAAAGQSVPEVDLLGPLLEALAKRFEQPPLGHPGRYHALNREYFDRVAAIEYTLAHDDGQHPDGWDSADIVLIGVSRTGKTPLSVYLSVLGWKVANVPVVPGWAIPAQLQQLDPGRVFGLTIELERLLALRLQRYQHMGVRAPLDYINPQLVALELEAAQRIFRRAGFHILNVTNRPIESSADEVIHLLEQVLEHTLENTSDQAMEQKTEQAPMPGLQAMPPRPAGAGD